MIKIIKNAITIISKKNGYKINGRSSVKLRKMRLMMPVTIAAVKNSSRLLWTKYVYISKLAINRYG